MNSDRVYAALKRAAFDAVRNRLEVDGFLVVLESVLVATLPALAAYELLARLVPARGAWLGAAAGLGVLFLGGLVGWLRAAPFRRARPVTAEMLFAEALAPWLKRTTGDATDFVGLTTLPGNYPAVRHDWAIAHWQRLHEEEYEGGPFPGRPELLRIGLVLGLALSAALAVAFGLHEAPDANAPLAALDPATVTLPVLLATLLLGSLAFCGLCLLAAGLGRGRVEIGSEAAPPVSSAGPLPGPIAHNRIAPYAREGTNGTTH
jgi:hypothetical protein